MGIPNRANPSRPLFRLSSVLELKTTPSTLITSHANHRVWQSLEFFRMTAFAHHYRTGCRLIGRIRSILYWTNGLGHVQFGGACLQIQVPPQERSWNGARLDWRSRCCCSTIHNCPLQWVFCTPEDAKDKSEAMRRKQAQASGCDSRQKSQFSHRNPSWAGTRWMRRNVLKDST